MKSGKSSGRRLKLPKISDRLTAVASLVTAGNSVCDVGCDHGFVPIYLAAAGISPRVIAMDVRKGPLEGARQHIAEYGLEQLIETRLSDGLSQYEAGEADSLIMAGMGGPLMCRILEAFPEKTESFKELILQPQSEVASFRKRLRELGWDIIDERMVCEERKYYPMMRAVKGRSAAVNEPELEDAYGPVLLKQKDAVLLRYLLWERSIIDGILEKKPDLEKWQKQSALNDKALHIVK